MNLRAHGTTLNVLDPGHRREKREERRAKREERRGKREERRESKK